MSIFAQRRSRYKHPEGRHRHPSARRRSRQRTEHIFLLPVLRIMKANKGEFPVLSSVCSTKDYLSALCGNDQEFSNVGVLIYRCVRPTHQVPFVGFHREATSNWPRPLEHTAFKINLVLRNRTNPPVARSPQSWLWPHQVIVGSCRCIPAQTARRTGYPTVESKMRVRSPNLAGHTANSPLVGQARLHWQRAPETFAILP